MSKPGHTNNPNGRPKGALNKRTEKVVELIEQSKLDPIEFDVAVLNWDLEKLNLTEAQIADIDTRTQLEMRQHASDSLKPYAYPKLRAVEISLDEESSRGLTLAYANPAKQ